MDDLGRFCDHLAAGIASYAARPVRCVLDFGGGDGSIVYGVCQRLAKAASGSKEVDVVDYGRQPVAAAQDEGIRIQADPSLEESPTEAYDVVLASGVIEHLPDPQQVISQLLDRVEPGGLFYARTP